MFTTIYHPLRKRLGLSCNEYCVADTVRLLSGNPGAPVAGWCTASRGYIAESLDISRQTVITAIQKLIGAGILEENEAKYLRATQMFFDAVTGAKEEPVKKLDRVSKNLTPTQNEGCQESLHPVKKLDTPCQETLQQACQESLHPPVKNLDTIYIDHIDRKNINTDKDSSTAAVATATPAERVTVVLDQSNGSADLPKPALVPNEAPGRAAKPTTPNHLFSNSPYASKDAFCAAFVGTDYAIYDAGFYYELVKNWANSKGALKRDWLATARNFMLSDAQKNQARLRADLQPQQQQSNGNFASRNGRQTDAEFANTIDSLAAMRYGRGNNQPEERTGAYAAGRTEAVGFD